MSFSKGYLEIYFGPMSSGKTTMALENLWLFAENLGMSCLYINHKHDNRKTSGSLSPHNPFLSEDKFEKIDFIKLDSLKGKQYEQYDIICVDEAQFFDEELLNFVKYHVDTLAKHLIVVGLDSNYKREKFGYILDLIPIADKVQKVKKAYCVDCGVKKEPAIFSYRISNEDTEIVVGGKDKYKPLCRKCYLDKF